MPEIHDWIVANAWGEDEIWSLYRAALYDGRVDVAEWLKQNVGPPTAQADLVTLACCCNQPESLQWALAQGFACDTDDCMLGVLDTILNRLGIGHDCGCSELYLRTDWERIYEAVNGPVEQFWDAMAFTANLREHPELAAYTPTIAWLKERRGDRPFPVHPFARHQ